MGRTMSLRVLGICASPRARGNSELLLDEALSGAQSVGATVSRLSLRELTIAPCTECGHCEKTGQCGIADDYQQVLAEILDADRLIFSTPVFFMSVSAQGKLLIDRCQCLWSRKYVLKQPLFDDGTRDRRAMVIAVGGSKSRKMFESISLTMKYWLDALEMQYASNLFVNRVDARGRIVEHAEATKEAFRLGRELADPNTPVSQRPVTVELIEGTGNSGLR